MVDHLAERRAGICCSCLFSVYGVGSLIEEESERAGKVEPASRRPDEVSVEDGDSQEVQYNGRESDQGDCVGRKPGWEEGSTESPVCSAEGQLYTEERARQQQQPAHKAGEYTLTPGRDLLKSRHTSCKKAEGQSRSLS